MSQKQFKNLKIWITILSCILSFFMKSNIDWTNFQNNYVDWQLVKEILYDLSVGVFSAMILVWFIDEINNKMQERKSQLREKDVIKRFDKVLQNYIKQYELTFYCVATPLLERKFQNVYMPERFTLKDMRDLYQPSLLLRDKLSSCSIDSFLKIELELRKEFISLVEQHDFEFYPQFSELFLSYIQTSLAFDNRQAILDVPSRMMGNRKLADFVHELLDVHADNYYQRILNGEDIGPNMAYSYIFLYEMMKAERKIILKYKEEIKKLG